MFFVGIGRLSRMLVFWAGLLAAASWGYPEYAAFVERSGHRFINCGFCHVNQAGPEGTGRGQLGKLDEKEKVALAQARAAFAPGTVVNSPILNEFGNAIIKDVGRKLFQDLLRDCALTKDTNLFVKVAEKLDRHRDIDGDGIPDFREYLDATHPLMALHGNPYRMFLSGIRRHVFPVVAGVLGFLLLAIGLHRLNTGLECRTRERNPHAHLH